MLHKETVSPEILGLLNELFSFSELDEFVLVGGTALSLQIGHRKSVDIDLFTVKGFNVDFLLEFFEDNNFHFKIQNRFKRSILGFVKGTKTDLIYHPYPWVSDFITEDKIRMASLADITAMKLNAIIGSGSRLKDFIDIAYLSEHFTLNAMLDFYERKYPNVNALMAMKSLCYFEDIDFASLPEMINKEISWKVIEKRLLEMVKFPEKHFSELTSID